MDSYHVLQFDDTDAGHFWHYRHGQTLDYIYEHIASAGSLDVVNLPTISAGKKMSLHKQLTLYTSRKSLQHLLATGVQSCEEPWSAHEQTCKISRDELPNPIKQRRDDLRKNHFFVYLPFQCRLLILVDSCAEWGWPDTLGSIQGDIIIAVLVLWKLLFIIAIKTRRGRPRW